VWGSTVKAKAGCHKIKSTQLVQIHIMCKIKQQDSSNDTMYKPLLLEQHEDLDLLTDEPPLTFPQAILPSVKLLLFLLKFSVKNPIRIVTLYALLLAGIHLWTNGTLCAIGWATFVGFPTVLIAFIVLAIAHVFVTKRQAAFDSAHSVLWERTQQGRAFRKEGSYDVFLPAAASFQGDDAMEEKKDDASMTCKHGIIFFPGALISHTAYASLAAKLSDHGIVVVIMSYGPSRLSMDVARCERRAQLIMHELECEFAVDQWSLAGHSLGGTLALNAAAQMDSIEKIILCGVGRDAMGAPSSLRTSSKQVLVLNGSNDPFVSDCTPEQKQKFRDCLPPAKEEEEEDSLEKLNSGMATFVTIKGGNHAGFAHYGPQTYPKRDGKRTISIDEQQDIFVQNTLELLHICN
jgi:predicted esterase